jgi:phospholipase/carboxylesterase
MEMLPAEGAPQLLFILLPGEDDARRMDALALRLAGEYRQAAVVSMDAALPPRWAEALPEFVRRVRELSARFGVNWEHTALAGFSSTATLALEAVQAEPELVGRVLSFCGQHVVAPQHAPVDTSVHLFHGMADRIVPPAPVVDAAERLVALGADVTADLLPGIGHELHPLLVDKAIGQLRTFLPKKVWREAMSEAPVIPRAASSDELSGSD